MWRSGSCARWWRVRAWPSAASRRCLRKARPASDATRRAASRVGCAGRPSSSLDAREASTPGICTGAMGGRGAHIAGPTRNHTIPRGGTSCSPSRALCPSSRSYPQAAQQVARNWWVLLLNGALLIVAGVLVFSIDWTIRDLATFIGALFIFQGVTEALTTGIDARVRQANVIAGLLSIATGILIIVWPEPGVLAVAIVLGAWLIVKGTFAISGAFAGASCCPTGGCCWSSGCSRSRSACSRSPTPARRSPRSSPSPASGRSPSASCGRARLRGQAPAQRRRPGLHRPGAQRRRARPPGRCRGPRRWSAVTHTQKGAQP